MISRVFYMRYVCVAVLKIAYKGNNYINERIFIQKNTESNITDCKSLQSNIITSYILLLRKVSCYFESNILRNLVTK